jgi:hypothetical protein
MATLQTTTVTGGLTLNGSPVSGGKSLKYQAFTSSGTFTPTAAAISAGGIHHIFIVGGGERGNTNLGGCGGEVVERFTTLTNTTGCAVTIGAGGTSDGANGGASTFAGASAGGITITAAGGAGNNKPTIKTSGAGGTYSLTAPAATIVVSAPARGQVVFNPGPSQYWYAYAYQAAYAYAYQRAYAYSSGAGSGYKGYGAGGSGGVQGIVAAKANSGSGTAAGNNAGTGYCLVTWYE